MEKLWKKVPSNHPPLSCNNKSYKKLTFPHTQRQYLKIGKSTKLQKSNAEYACKRTTKRIVNYFLLVAAQAASSISILNVSKNGSIKNTRTLS